MSNPAAESGIKAQVDGIAKEVGDIREAVAQLRDGDPTNNGRAIGELFESGSKILGHLGVAAASIVFTLQQLGVL